MREGNAEDCGRLAGQDSESVYASSKFASYVESLPWKRDGDPWITAQFVYGNSGDTGVNEDCGVEGRIAKDAERLFSFSEARLIEQVRGEASVEVGNFISSYCPGVERSSEAGSGRPVGEGGDGGRAGGEDSLSASGAPGSSQSSDGGTRYLAEERHGSGGTTMKRRRGSPCFSSYEEGVERNIIYRSVVQAKGIVDEFENGEDSDAANGVMDEDWRIRLHDVALEDFNDITAQENVYMSIWNHFVLIEVFVHSDERQLLVVSGFASTYGALLFHMKLHVVFVAHLRELYRRGLIDATGMHHAVLEAGKARVRAVTGDGPSVADLKDRLSWLLSLSGSGSCKWNSAVP